MLENSNSTGENYKYVKLVAPQWPTEEFPKFVVQGWKEENYALTDETYTKLSWVVSSIKTTHNGKTGKDEVRGFEAVITDGEENVVIKSTMSNASKDLANHLLGNVWKEVKISLYINNNSYPASSVRDAGGEFAPTHLPFKGLDRDELYNEIKGQEKEAPVKEESITPEDVPF